MTTKIHITEIEKMDNRKEYNKILELMEDHHSNYTTIMNHMEKTTPIFGEWNYMKDCEPAVRRIQQKHNDYIVGCNDRNEPDKTKPKVKVSFGACDFNINIEKDGIVKSVYLA